MSIRQTLPLACLVGFSFLVGCGVSEDKYPERFGEAACTAYEECGVVDAFGGTVEECMEWVVPVTAEWIGSDACEYDPKAARQCLKYNEDIDCEAAYGDATSDEEDPCDSVCGDSAD